MRLVVIEVLTHIAHDRLALQEAIKSKVGSGPNDPLYYRVKKRSLDARKTPMKMRLEVAIYTSQSEQEDDSSPPLSLRSIEEQPRTLVIVGAGPAGLFAGLRALSLGLKPVIVERGRAVRDRRRDLAVLNRIGQVDPDSNYCFGEGGAGTYSDGKLYTRSKKRGAVHAILKLLVDFGAPEEILIEAHPHIGTNRLPKVIEAIRTEIINRGGEVRFESKVVDLLCQRQGANVEVQGVELANGEQVYGDAGVILATGHSARDIFTLLARRGVLIEAKPFALGVRVEHPQELIDQRQYHGTRPPELGSASYRLVTQVSGRGVFSFCMCPGGIIAPAATAPGEVVVNGWSPYKRNGQFANSGLVVSVDKEDFAPFAQSEGDPLAGMRFQASVEQLAFEHGGKSGVTAPAQKINDFMKRRTSTDIPRCSYVPGTRAADLRAVLPSQVSDRLAEAFKVFSKRIKGFNGPEAIMLGVESRTSSPVRIPRDRNTLEHPTHTRLFPCGEGAGYAGGIISAALDGFRCAEAAAAKWEITDLWSEQLSRYE